MKTIYFISIVLLLNLTSCATTHISRDDAQSELAAKKPFSSFNRFFMKKITINASLEDDYDNKKAIEIINNNLYNSLLNVFGALDFYSEFDPSRPEKTLIIEPTIEKIKSVGAGTRFVLGVFAGGSAVVLKTTYIDAGTNEVIAAPSFYQHANAWAATYKSGRDKQMLNIITQDAADYAINNY